MIIKYQNGDLVTMIQNSLNGSTPPIQVAHGCNCCRVMGGGIAGAFRKFPEILEADRNYPLPTLGEMSVANIMTDKTFPEHTALVFNLYTQQYFGTQKRHVNYSAIAHCFARIDQEGACASPLYIPRIGAGLAGGEWKVIEEIINDATRDLEIIVIDYEKGTDPRTEK